MIKSKRVNDLKNANINKMRSHFSSFKVAKGNGNVQCWQRLKIFLCKADKRKRILYLNLAKYMKILKICIPFDPPISCLQI